LLRQDGTPVPLLPKAFEALTYLVEREGLVLDKDELMRAIWPDTFVEENNLTQIISTVRRALGEARGEHRYIATVPGRGYQFVADVRPAGPGTSLTTPPARSIVVLPFANVGHDAALEYFADGLADDLIASLSRLNGLRVVARTSAFFFKDRPSDIREIAKHLGVHLVLEGSVRRSGPRLRVTAQLINAADGCHVWSDRYDREMDMRDVLTVQDEIREAVLTALTPNLAGVDQRPVLEHKTANAAAYEMYLKGRFHLFRMTPAGIDAGVQYFKDAITHDPSYALAYVGLAHAQRVRAVSLERSPGEVASEGKAAALRALEIDRTLAEAHAVLAFHVYWFEWDWETAEKHFTRALKLNPNSADTYWMYAHLPSSAGRHDEALEAIAQARALDPLSGLINAVEGQCLLHAGRTDDAIVRLREAIELDPKSRIARLIAARAYIEKGMLDAAVQEAREAHALTPSNSRARSLEIVANARRGERREARAAFKTLLQLSRERYVAPYNLAVACNGLDDTADAIAWLERACDSHDLRMVFLNVDPAWNNLRSDMRFRRLLKRMRFA
jgi:TolB-like protein/Tfp pilus assembly protein PilF